MIKDLIQRLVFGNKIVIPKGATMFIVKRTPKRTVEIVSFPRNGKSSSVLFTDNGWGLVDIVIEQ